MGRTPAPSTPSNLAPAGGLFAGFGAKPAELGKDQSATGTGTSTPKEAPKADSLFAASTQPAAGGLFGGFGAKPVEPAKDQSATGTSTPKEAPKTNSLFTMPTPAAAPAPAAATDDASKKADAGPAQAPAGGSLFGNFGAKPATTTTTTTTTTPAVPSSLGATSTTGTTTAPKANATQEPAPSVVKGKTFNEIVERFEAELEDQVSRFKDQAAEVREWDMILIENSQNVRRSVSNTHVSVH